MRPRFNLKIRPRGAITDRKTRQSARACSRSQRSFVSPSPKISEKGVKTEFQCKICLKYLSTKYTLEYHLRNHSGERPFKCRFCEKTFGHKAAQLVHERIHTGVRPYKCNYCDKTFTQQSNLLQHTKQHTSGKAYVCKYCDYAAASAAKLKDHQVIHKGIQEELPLRVKAGINQVGKQFKCRFCKKTFAHKSYLNVHTRVHTGSKPYTCKYCSYASAYYGNLQVHERIHTGERPLKCPYCPQRFAHPNNFRFHKQKCSQSSRCTVRSQVPTKEEGQRQNPIKRRRRRLAIKLSFSNPTPSSSSQCLQNSENNGKENLDTSHVNGEGLDPAVVKALSCPQCLKYFLSANDFTSHQKDCKQSFNCGYCLFRSENFPELVWHLRTHPQPPAQVKRPTVSVPQVLAIEGPPLSQVNQRVVPAIQVLAIEPPQSEVNQPTVTEALTTEVKPQCDETYFSYRLCSVCKYYCESEAVLAEHLYKQHKLPRVALSKL